MPVVPLDPERLDLPRFVDYAAAADERYARFLAAPSGVAVWQRVRVGEVFRDGCAKAEESLRWQIGALHRSLDYLTDAPTYLEPWYGIGTTAAAFGARYEWPQGQSPAVLPPYRSLDELPEKLEACYLDSPVLSTTLDMIRHFLEQTKGEVPLSWCDIQGPLNVAGGIVDITQLLEACYEASDKVRQVLDAATRELLRFTKLQSDLLGNRLARPGHGFASSRRGTGIGLSTDNLIMLSPAMFVDYCAAGCDELGTAFGGAAMHSCGNWARWIPAVKEIKTLSMVDGAFSPRTDPAYNRCEDFRDAFAGTPVIVHARLVGDPEEVMAHVKRLWKPGLRLIVVTHLQDPQAQHQLYRDIHAYCR